MNKIEFMEGVHILQDNYNRTLSETQLKLFYENLKDMSKDKYISNIKEYIKTKRTKNVGIPLNIDELAAYIAGGSL